MSLRSYPAGGSSLRSRCGGIDILATNSEAKRAVTIQCKSSKDRNKSWILSDKAEHFTSKNHYYVFVKLGAETERPAQKIVLSRRLASELNDLAEFNCETEDCFLINYSAFNQPVFAYANELPT